MTFKKMEMSPWETQRLNILEWLGKDFRAMNITNPDESGVLKAMKNLKISIIVLCYSKSENSKSKNHSKPNFKKLSMDTTLDWKL